MIFMQSSHARHVILSLLSNAGHMISCDGYVPAKWWLHDLHMRPFDFHTISACQPLDLLVIVTYWPHDFHTIVMCWPHDFHMIITFQLCDCHIIIVCQTLKFHASVMCHPLNFHTFVNACHMIFTPFPIPTGDFQSIVMRQPCYFHMISTYWQ